MSKAKLPAPPRRSLATFRATHDASVRIPMKIKATLESIRRQHGDQAYVYENQNPTGENALLPLSKLVGTSAAIIGEYRAQFIDHIVKTPQDTGAKRAARLVWFVTAKAATEARGGPPNPSDIE